MSKGKTDVQTFMSSPGREESFLNEGTLTRFYKGEDRSDTSFDLDLKSITWDYDLLTGLPCMKKFLDLVSTDFQQYENYVFLYFNLTNFKLFMILLLFTFFSLLMSLRILYFFFWNF